MHYSHVEIRRPHCTRGNHLHARNFVAHVLRRTVEGFALVLIELLVNGDRALGVGKQKGREVKAAC